ncbi:MAG: molybdopterin-dependent oxidoreductase, partial [Mycobacteriales bacterium]
MPSARKPSAPPPPRVLGLMGSAGAGVLSAATAVAAGELVGQVVPGTASPLLSVGNLTVYLASPGLRDAAVGTLGTADKPVLVAGVVVVVALLGMLSGVLARRRLSSAYVVVVVLALMAGLAVSAQSSASPVGALLVAAILAAAGCSALRLLLGERVAGAGPMSGPAAPDRRLLLLRSGLLAALVLVGGGVSRALATRVDVEKLRATLRLPPPTRPAPGDVAAGSFDIEGISPLVTSNTAFYRIDTALSVPRVDSSTWSLQIIGMVDRPLTLTYADLLGMRQYEADITMQCVSNEVGGDLVG